MAYNASRRTRERRLRAKYRKRVWTAAIIMLIIGLILGFVACVVTAKKSDRVAELLNLSPKDQQRMAVLADTTEDPLTTVQPTDVLTSTPLPLATEAPEAGPTLAIVQVNENAVSAASIEDEDADAGIVPQNADGDETDAVPAIASVPLATPESSEAPEAMPADVTEPTAAPIEEAATAEPTVEPTAAPTAVAVADPVFVPYGEACTFETQIKADGSARRTVDDEAYETLSLTVKVTAYKDTAYFEENYADSYNLQGNEAAVEFQITLNGYTGTTEIIPQNFLLITLSGQEEDVTAQGFQLMDSEIAGKTEVAITSDTTATLYKRYPYNADQGDMSYMVVHTYMDGVETAHCFEILQPEAETPVDAGEDSAEAASEGSESASGTSTEEALTIGSKGDAVKKLQRVLIDNKLLSGEPDGHFGKYTAEAVKEMQRKFGMEATGVADQAFLDKLYAEE